MARIPPLDPDSAPEEARSMFERDLETYGFVLNTTRVAAYRPSIATAVRQLAQAVSEAGSIDPQLRLLMNVRIATLVGCPF